MEKKQKITANLHHPPDLWVARHANVRVPNVHEVTCSSQVLNVLSQYP